MKQNYTQRISIPHELNKKILRHLNAIRKSDRLTENETISVVASFPDDVQMDVKCCGDDDGPAWTEAVLFNKNGGQIACTEPGIDFAGAWSLTSDDGTTYTTILTVEPDTSCPVPRVVFLTLTDVDDENDVAFPVEVLDDNLRIDDVVNSLKDSATAWVKDHPETRDSEPDFRLWPFVTKIPNDHHEKFKIKILTRDEIPHVEISIHEALIQTEDLY